MVVSLPQGRDHDDLLFHALADATRRDIIARVHTGEHSVSALARSYPISVTAVQKHVAVLERAALVTKERRGREQIVRANPNALRRAYDALDAIEEVWRGRVERMSTILVTDPEGGIT